MAEDKIEVLYKKVAGFVGFYGAALVYVLWIYMMVWAVIGPFFD